MVNCPPACPAMPFKPIHSVLDLTEFAGRTVVAITTAPLGWYNAPPVGVRIIAHVARDVFSWSGTTGRDVLCLRTYRNYDWRWDSNILEDPIEHMGIKMRLATPEELVTLRNVVNRDLLHREWSSLYVEVVTLWLH
jgi:hypothetical protein